MSRTLDIMNEELRINQAEFMLKQDYKVTIFLVSAAGMAVELPMGSSSAGKQIAQLAVCYRERVLEELKKKEG